MTQKNTNQNLYVIQSGQPLESSNRSVPVVLLHGLFGMARNLGGVARALADQYTVYSIDLPNHGRSPHSDTHLDRQANLVNMTIESMAKDVLATLDALGVNCFMLLGHSLGGKVAMHMALHFPHRVGKLLVADIAPVAYSPRHQSIFAALEGIDLTECESRAAVQKQLGIAIDDTAIAQFLLQSIEKTPQGLRWRMNLPAIKSSYHSLSAAVSAPPNSQGFSKPTLFIGGENSHYILPEYEAATRALFPNFEFRQIAGAGHWLHAEKPRLFNAMVAKFFEPSSED